MVPETNMTESAAGDLVPVSKKMKLEVPREKPGLCDLPELPLLEIAKHLDAQDLLHFSHASSKVWRAVGTNSAIWSKLLKNLNFPASPRLDHLAASFSTLFPSSSDEKRKFLVYTKTMSNWKTADFSQVWTHHARMFLARNDILLFSRVCDGDYLDSDYSIWNFTAAGPGLATNWTSYQRTTFSIYEDDIFIFEDTVCIKFEDDLDDSL